MIVPLALFRCVQCGALGAQHGRCGLRRGLGNPPATVCEGKMEFLGWIELRGAQHGQPPPQPTQEG